MASLPPRSHLTTDDVPGAPEWIQPLLERINGFTGPVYDALQKGLTFGENFSGQVVDVTVTPPDDWAPVTFGAGWAQWVDGNFPRCSLRKDEHGFVEARGLVDNTGAGNYLATFATGSPYAPAPGDWSLQGVNAFMTFGSVIIRPEGIMYNAGDKSQWTSLAGLRWQAGDRSPVRWARPLDVLLGNSGRKFPGKPGFILPLSAERSDGQPTTSFVTSVGWDPVLFDRKKGAYGVRLHRLSGLSPGVSYRVSLLILPE